MQAIPHVPHPMGARRGFHGGTEQGASEGLWAMGQRDRTPFNLQPTAHSLPPSGTMFEHQDELASLNGPQPLLERLEEVHRIIQNLFRD